MNMKAHLQSRNGWWALGVAVAVGVGAGVGAGVGGCFGGGGDDNNNNGDASATEVPDSAGATSAAFTSYIQGLDKSDETSEPLKIKGSFTTPADDDTADPVPLT
jgi:hypothetical protein